MTQARQLAIQTPMNSIGNFSSPQANSIQVSFHRDFARVESGQLRGLVIPNAYLKAFLPRGLLFTPREIAGARQQATAKQTSFSQAFAAGTGSKPTSAKPTGLEVARTLSRHMPDPVRTASPSLAAPRAATAAEARPRPAVDTPPKPMAASVAQRNPALPMSDAGARGVLGIGAGKALTFNRINLAFNEKTRENSKTVPLSTREANAAELKKAKDVLTKTAHEESDKARAEARETLQMEPGETLWKNHVERHYDVMCDSLPKGPDSEATRKKFAEARLTLLELAK